MIVLKGYKKEAALMVRLKKLSRVFGFTVEREFVNPESNEESEGLKSEILQLNSKTEALEGENIVLTENHEQLNNELVVAKDLISERDAQVLELNAKIDELNSQLNSKTEVKEPRKRRTKAEIEADKKDK
jgi:hypothetical protein